jgi:bifunctional non-homologous end joining protein LigD
MFPLEIGDKALHVARETRDVARSDLTHPDRVVFPARGRRRAVTKADVAAYYGEVAEWMLPHVRDRPLVFRRYPHGIEGAFFYTKDWREFPPPAKVRTVEVFSETRGEAMLYALAQDAASLVWVAQTGAVEVHPWLSKLGSDPAACATERGLATLPCGLDRPDLVLFDLDPYVRAGRTGSKGTEAGGEPGLDPEDWSRALDVAWELRDTLLALKLPHFVKTSGKRGLHVVVPVEPEHPYDRVRAFAQTIGAAIAARRPDLVTLSYDPKTRAGRVFLDCNQNARGKTMAAPYSLRPTPQATVSMPLAWDELETADPAAYDVRTAVGRLREKGDAWAALDDARVRLRDAIGA